MVYWKAKPKPACEACAKCVFLLIFFLTRALGAAIKSPTPWATTSWVNRSVEQRKAGGGSGISSEDHYCLAAAPKKTERIRRPNRREQPQLSKQVNEPVAGMDPWTRDNKAGWGGARQASLWLWLRLRLSLSGPTSLGLGTGTEPNRSEPHRICGMNSLEMIEISFHCDDEGEGEQEIEFNSIPRLVCRLLLLLPWSSLLLPGLLCCSLVFSASLCYPLLLPGLPCFFLVCFSSLFCSSLLLPSFCFSHLLSASPCSSFLLPGLPCSSLPPLILFFASAHPTAVWSSSCCFGPVL